MKTETKHLLAWMLMAVLAVLTLFPAQITAKAAGGTPVISYATHVQNIGWQTPVSGGAVSGTTGRSFRLEAIAISIDSAGATDSLGNPLTGTVTTTVHCQDYGWLPKTETPVGAGKVANLIGGRNYAGTTGRSKRLEAIRIALSGSIAAEYDIFYRVHVQNIGWQDWVRNGELAGTTGRSLRLEAIEIRLVKRISYKDTPVLSYSAHSPAYGWDAARSEGIAGTTGKSQMLDALTVSVNGKGIGGGISVSAHVQNIGWQSAVGSGQTAGTVGRNLRMEAVKISLTGDLAFYYDIYYRVHIQDKGWLAWAKNGAPAGSAGGSKRVEAIELLLLSKEATPLQPQGPAFINFDWKSYPGSLSVRVNKQANCVTVYKGTTPVKSMICSAGPATPEGSFNVAMKWRWLGLVGGVSGQYCTQIQGDYLFHSVPYTQYGNIRSLQTAEYNKLGTLASHGCIRLTVEDAKWIYDNCPTGTPITIYSSADPGPLGKPSAAKLPPNQTWDPTDPGL